MPEKTETIATEWDVLDERFRSIKGDKRVERIDLGCRWAEGPVYVPAGRYFLVSDIPNDRIMRWDETTGAIGVFRHPAGYANGNTLDGSGRLVTCEHGNRRVTRTEHDGTITVLADSSGTTLNSPNDVVARTDGSVWFSDPAYGIDSDYEGHRADSEIGGCHLYRLDPVDGTCEIVADDFDRPNGLAFSLDETQLYVTDTGARHIRRFDVADDGALSGGEVLATCTEGGFDGVRLDDQGRLWAAARDGVHCLDADGTLLGKLLVPETTSNLVFGGPKRNHLFVSATTSVYALLLDVRGAAPVWAASGRGGQEGSPGNV